MAGRALDVLPANRGEISPRKHRANQHEYWRQFRARLTERDIAPAETVLLMLTDWVDITERVYVP